MWFIVVVPLPNNTLPCVYVPIGAYLLLKLTPPACKILHVNYTVCSDHTVVGNAYCCQAECSGFNSVSGF